MNTFIFDMDGLMFDTERLYVEAFDYSGEKIGIGKAGYMVMRTLGMTDELWQKCFRDEFGDSYDEVGLLEYTDDFIADYYSKNHMPVKKGLYGLLDFLKGRNCNLAVASSSSYATVHHHLNDAGISQYFGAVVTGDMVSRSKPDPEIYLKACKLLNRQPEECYALEDSPVGLRSANVAGCKAILVPDLWQPTKEDSSLYYKKFNDLDEVRVFFTAQFL